MKMAMKSTVKTMMKNLAALLALVLLFGGAAPAEEDAEMPYAEQVPESLVFDSLWIADGTVVDAVCEDGGFRVCVTREIGTDERMVWEYSAMYDPDSGTLFSVWNGMKTHLYMSGRFAEYSRVESEECTAVFSISENGSLIWLDGQEDAGKGMEFRRASRFAGSYVCGRAGIDITWDAVYGYFIYIDWADSAFANCTWVLNGTYGDDLETLIASGTATRTEYGENGEVLSVEDTDGECRAVFRFDENHMLVWTGTDGVDTEGMEFEYVGPVIENG